MDQVLTPTPGRVRSVLILVQRLISLDNSFASFESKAESFHAAQTRQAEMQARLHNEMQIDMNTTRGLLDNITSSTANIYTNFQTASGLIGQLDSLFGKMAGATGWIPTVTCVPLLLFVLWFSYRRFVLRAIALIGQPSLEWNLVISADELSSMHNYIEGLRCF